MPKLTNSGSVVRRLSRPYSVSFSCLCLVSPDVIADAMTDQMSKQQREELLDDLFDGVPDEGEEAKRIVEEEKAKLLRPLKRRKIG